MGIETVHPIAWMHWTGGYAAILGSGMGRMRSTWWTAGWYGSGCAGVTDQPGLSGCGRSRDRDGYRDTRAMFGRYEGTDAHNTVLVYNTVDSCSK